MKPGGRERHLPHYHARPANQQCPRRAVGAWAGVVGAGNKAHEIASEHVAGTVLPTMSNSRNPDPEVSRRPRSRAPSTPPGRWPIGDTVWDVQDARAAGIGCIGVETGGFSQHELSQTGALQVYRDVKEVLDQLHTSPLAVLLR